MVGIVTVAYAVGGAVRYNIRNIETISDSETTDNSEQRLFKWMERAAKFVLARVAQQFLDRVREAFCMDDVGTVDVAKFTDNRI